MSITLDKNIMIIVKHLTEQILQKQQTTKVVEADPTPYYMQQLAYPQPKSNLRLKKTSFMIIVVPIIIVLIANYVVQRTTLSELEKVVYTVGPAVVFINFVIAIYIYKVIKDPENYKRDEFKVPMKKQD